MLLWPGAATSPSAVSKFCGILGNGRGFDPYVNVRNRILLANCSKSRKSCRFMCIHRGEE